MKALNRYALLLVGAGLLAGCEGGMGGYDPKAHGEMDSAEAKFTGKAKPEYHELQGKDGKIYVAGSQAGLQRAQAGQKFAMHKIAFGYGPNKETVVFEDNKEGMGDFLEMEYKKKHGG